LIFLFGANHDNLCLCYSNSNQEV